MTAPWRLEYAVLASSAQDGDTMRVSNIRDFAWTSETTAIPRYYDAAFNLNEVKGVDLVMSYWAGDEIAHVFVSLTFDDGRHLAVSVKTRRAAGQDSSTLGGFFRNYELIYVIADERDLIGVRTDMWRERVYIYPLHTTPGTPRLLAKTPQFYNTLTDNCTSNVASRIAAMLGSGGGLRYIWKLLVERLYGFLCVWPWSA